MTETLSFCEHKVPVKFGCPLCLGSIKPCLIGKVGQILDYRYCVECGYEHHKWVDREPPK